MPPTRLGSLGITIEDKAQELLQSLQGTTFQRLNQVGFLPPLKLQGADELALGSSGFKLGLNASLALQVSAFNTSDDVDSDSVVTPTAEESWLKNDIGATIQADAGGTAGSATFGLEADAEAHLLDYRKHRPTDAVATAVLRSFEGARFATRWEDVLEATAEGDRLALLARGRIAFTVGLSSTDVFAAGISALDRVLGVTGAAAFQVTVGSSVTFNLAASDDFRLVFSRGAAKPIAVELKKAAGRSTSVAARLGVTAGFRNPQQLAKLISAYLAGRFGEELKQVEDLLARIEEGPNLDSLGPLKPLAERLADRLGISAVQNRAAALRSRLQSLQEAIGAAVSKKVELAFTFSYTRIEARETVLKFEVTAEAFKDFYGGLLLGNTQGVLKQLADGSPGFLFGEYLQTRTLQTSRSFGASLRMGDWAFGGTNTVTRNRKEQRDLRNRVRLNLDGRKSYKAQWNKNVEEYGFELSAAMESFADRPQGRDFQLRMGLDWMWTERMSPQLSQTIADVATVWRIVNVTERDRIRAALERLQGRVQADLELSIDDAGVRRLAQVSEADLQSAWKQAMAEALPPIFFSNRTFRDTLEERMFTYAIAADGLFSQTSTVELPSGMKYRTGEEQLRVIDLELDRGRPNSISNVFKPISLLELWNRGERHRDRCKRAARALAQLRGFALGGGEPDDVLDTFRTFQDLLTQAFTARLLGSVLARLLEGTGAITATGKVVPEAGGEAVVIA